MRRIVREAEQAVAARAAKTVRDMKRKAPGWEYMRPAKKQAVNVSSDVIHDPLPGGRQRSAQEARDAVRMRLEQVLGDRFSLVEQGRTNYFTIANRQVLSGHPAVRALPTRIREAILKDDSKRTPLERGSSTVLVGMSSGSRAGFSFDQLEAITEQVLEPSALAGGTRDGYELGIRKAFSFFLSHGKLRNTLPMTLADLKKLLTELVIAGESVGCLRTTASAISKLHARAGFDSPRLAGAALTTSSSPTRWHRAPRAPWRRRSLRSTSRKC